MLQCLHIAVSSSFLWMKGAFFHHANETNKKNSHLPHSRDCTADKY
jgi:hypothetical protein